MDYKLELSTELTTHIDEINEIPKNESDFKEWLSYITVKNGTGKHVEFYLGEGNELVKVNFTVVLRTLSIEQN